MQCRHMKTSSPFKVSIFIFLMMWVTSSLAGDIQTSSGPIRGTEIVFNGKTLNQYLGVPYAKPPVGDLRFRKTQPVEPWTDPLVADKMPSACFQYVPYPFPWNDYQPNKSEDCLYLNIWAPVSESNNKCSAKKAVMFWIHGGAFVSGSNRKPLYNGQALAAEGDVIVVTINYRLGAFGFFTTGTDTAPGNAALYDMLEALKWVNQNIAAFGGDTERITVAGESAGSISAGIFCVSPLTKGLFHRVIMESGSPVAPSPPDSVNLGISQKLAVAVGCSDVLKNIATDPKGVEDCMRNVDALEIAKALESFDPKTGMLYLPSFGNEFLPTDAHLAVLEHKFHPVDTLIGNNADEGSVLIPIALHDVVGYYGRKDLTNLDISEVKSAMKSLFARMPGPASDTLADKFVGDKFVGDPKEALKVAYDPMGDFLIVCPSVYFAERVSEAGKNVYYYVFQHRPLYTVWAEWMRVIHFGEVQFVFGIPLQHSEHYSKEEIELSKKMVKYWTNFVKNGNPGQVNWPKYSRKDHTYRALDTDYLIPEFAVGPDEINCNVIFRPLFGFVP